MNLYGGLLDGISSGIYEEIYTKKGYVRKRSIFYTDKKLPKLWTLFLGGKLKKDKRRRYYIDLRNGVVEGISSLDPKKLSISVLEIIFKSSVKSKIIDYNRNKIIYNLIQSGSVDKNIEALAIARNINADKIANTSKNIETHDLIVRKYEHLIPALTYNKNISSEIKDKIINSKNLSAIRHLIIKKKLNENQLKIADETIVSTVNNIMKKKEPHMIIDYILNNLGVSE